MDKDLSFSVGGKLCVFRSAKAAWYYIKVPKKESNQIKQSTTRKPKGWGSIPVAVSINDTEWNTSIFPDKKTGTYLLFIKANIRKKEKIEEGGNVSLTFRINASYNTSNVLTLS